MISLEDARSIIAAGERKAVEIGQPMNIAVVDFGGNLVAHVRAEGNKTHPGAVAACPTVPGRVRFRDGNA